MKKPVPILKQIARRVRQRFFKQRVIIGEPLAYRVYLLEELLERASAETWQGKRMLEIGPRDGLDSKRLMQLKPSELVMLDLPEKRGTIHHWLTELTGQYRYIEANFMYMQPDELVDLGHFDLIWCTGVLYHNAEQLRLLRRMYRMLNPGGFLVLESATTRNPALKDIACVELHYPDRYRNTSTVTHLPSALAIKSWLRMAGFLEVYDSNCFQPQNADLIGQRYACVCKKTGDDDGDIYYISADNPMYRFGDST